jgi:hypothetical protein
MAKSVDARDLKSLGGNPMRVRFPLPAWRCRRTSAAQLSQAPGPMAPSPRLGCIATTCTDLEPRPATSTASEITALIKPTVASHAGSIPAAWRCRRTSAGQLYSSAGAHGPVARGRRRVRFPFPALSLNAPDRKRTPRCRAPGLFCRSLARGGIACAAWRRRCRASGPCRPTR